MLLRDIPEHLADYHNALHEAAHAVVGAAFGFTITSITVTEPFVHNPRNGRSGEVRWTTPSTTTGLEYAAACMAGEAAGLRWLTTSGYDTEANRADVYIASSQDVMEILSRMPDHFLQPGRDAAAQAVDKHWRTITALAALVAAHRYIDGAEVHRLIAA